MKAPLTNPLPTPAVVLSAHHHRILRSHLCHLDDGLSELGQILDADRNLGPVGTPDIGMEQSAVAHDRIARMREIMAAFARRWQIDMTRFKASPSQLALVHLAFLLVDLDELSPPALRGYGPVDLAFVEDYEVLLVKLYDGLERLKRDVIAADAAKQMG